MECDPSPLPVTRTRPKEVDWLLFNADWLVTCDAGMNRFRSGAVAIEGDRIAAVGPSDELRKLFRGRREDRSFGISAYARFDKYPHARRHESFPGCRRRPASEKVAQGNHLPAGECFRQRRQRLSGDTAFSRGDAKERHDDAFATAIFSRNRRPAPAFKSGIRAVLGQGILDFPSPDLPDPADFPGAGRNLPARFSLRSDRIRPSLFCHAPYTCGPEDPSETKELCRTHKILFQTHLSETAGEVGEIEQVRSKAGNASGCSRCARRIDAVRARDLARQKRKSWLSQRAGPPFPTARRAR